MAEALRSSEILGLIKQDSDLGAAALKYATPEVRRQLNLLVNGVFAADRTQTCIGKSRVRYTPLGVRDAYVQYE